jgi:type I restriction enzyme R subunit
VHSAVDALEPIKARADFEVYLKKFLTSLDLVMPGPAAQPYRGPARRLGYLMRMTKERFKDDSIDFNGVGAKVAELINRHLIDLGIDPQIPSSNCWTRISSMRYRSTRAGRRASRRAKWSMLLESIALFTSTKTPLYRRMSEKLDTLIARQGEDWKALAEQYEELRAEIRAGRQEPEVGRSSEVSVFRDDMFALLDDTAALSLEAAARLDALAEQLVGVIKDAVRVVDLWKKPDQIRKLRAKIDTELMVCGIEAVQSQHKRIAVELTKFAEKRHEELVRSCKCARERSNSL